MNPSVETPIQTGAPRLLVMVVHGTFARGGWLQIRRNWRAFWARLRGITPEEASLWPAPAPVPLDKTKPNQRHWFEAGSEFENDLIQRAGKLGLPVGSLVFQRVLWSGRNTFADREAAAKSLRQALADSAAANPGLPLAVLAHSHGGTVAVKALDAKHWVEPPPVQAVLTLGSPFVRLVERTPPDNQNTEKTPPETTFSDFVAAFLPGTLLALAPLCALAYGWLSSGPWALGLALALGALGMWAALTASVITAYLIVTVLMLFAGSALWPYFSALAMLAMAAPIFIFKKPLAASGWRYAERGPLRLTCPLLALRTPRDEASLVIALGQIAMGMGQLGARVAAAVWQPINDLIQRGEKFSSPATPTPRWKGTLSRGIVLLFGFVSVALLGGLGVLQAQGLDKIGTDLTGWWGVGLASIFFGPIVVMLITIFLALAWAIPTAAISLTAGREAFMLPAVTIVEAEPLPHAVGTDGQHAAAMSLEILYQAQLTGLNHSLYEADVVRQRIATWLCALVDKPS